MEIKKSDGANLEPRRFGFFTVGLVVTLSCVLMALEYREYYEKPPEIYSLPELNSPPEEIIPVFIVEKNKPIPPPPKPTTTIEIVKNDVLIPKNIVPVSNEPTKVSEPVINIPDIPEEVIVEDVLTFADKMPEYPGGMESLLQEVAQAVIYPTMAFDSGIQGVVYLSFVVNKEGEVEDVKVKKGIGGGCDEEAIRVIKSLKQWKPGYHRNKRVKVEFTIPIRFALE